MNDLLIKNGIIIDGSGQDRFVGDISIKDGLINGVGNNLGIAARIVDADGLLVTPGFVDVHTHYDGQVTWDPYLTPSTFHGVTTAVFGNCGVGFAPVRKNDVPYLINLMEGVEDIPGSVLSEGVDFNWESFPQYLDVLDSSPKAIDIGAQVPHGPLRFYVMGERGADHHAIPTDEEIESMGLMLEESLTAGAIGFTTSRTTKHLSRDGKNTPSLSAKHAELLGLALAMKRADKGIIEVNSDFGPGEFEIMRMVSEVSGRPLSILLLQTNNSPDLWRQTRDQIHQARAQGLNVTGQVGCRPIVLIMGLETTINPFSTHPKWIQLSSLTPLERLSRIKNDAQLRHNLIHQLPNDEHTRRIKEWLPRTFLMNKGFDYEPSPEDNICEIARKKSVSPFEVALDRMLQNEGKGLLAHTFENYFDGDLEVIREMLLDEGTIMGLGDGGAHVCTVCDEGAPTYLLSHWSRDRKRGPTIPLEFLVKKHTSISASGYGLLDRGLIQAGYKADLNVIDYEQLSLLDTEIVYDLPAGGKRLIQRARGYRHTFVSGTEIIHQDEQTGNLPGRLIR
ncbi:MAG: amidohydrolase family protein [Proteobacteria bacterium]|nr:amidohydrolase family protein [Pseudomonadota bacterium]MDA1331166.1 amidohydrolase family protein [Pseudomonadota bacterium]